MKLQWKRLIFCLLLPLGVGLVSALLTRGGMQTFETLAKPPLSPPGWLFPVVWTILYLLMGLASYLVRMAETDPGKKFAAWAVYGMQLFFNFFWSVWFFGMRLYTFAFVWLVALWALILLNLILFCRIRKSAGVLLVPYLLWVSFAGYLNLAIAILN